MHQSRRHGADDVPLSAYGADTEDYFAYLSDESMSDVEDAQALPVASKARDVVDELASAFASSSSISSNVLTPIGSLNGNYRHTARKEIKKPQEQVKAVSPGVFGLGGGEELRVSPRALAQHNVRRTQLQEALDAATSGGGDSGEAPFRFRTQNKKVVRFTDAMEVDEETSRASPAPNLERVEGHAPEKKHRGRRKPAGDEDDEESEEEGNVEPDPLYDEQLDDADEQWVQTNLRGVKPETDATLCCPCCFVTVCIVCERHATYTNQYRATAAINCRVKKEEILTYTTSEGSRVPASLPFLKRKNLSGEGNTRAATTGQQIARLLQQDEFYAVACSDCGTMVGVFDRDQHFHFFNALPSNC